MIIRVIDVTKHLLPLLLFFKWQINNLTKKIKGVDFTSYFPTRQVLNIVVRFFFILWHPVVLGANNYKLYRKDTEYLYHSFMYSLVSLLSGIYPFYATHSSLITITLQDIHEMNCQKIKIIIPPWNPTAEPNGCKWIC